MAKASGPEDKKVHDGIIRVVVSPKQSIAPMAINFFLGVSAEHNPRPSLSQRHRQYCPFQPQNEWAPPDTRYAQTSHPRSCCRRFAREPWHSTGLLDHKVPRSLWDQRLYVRKRRTNHTLIVEHRSECGKPIERHLIPFL
uniref:Similarity n=1 Tax=Microcystis aeruginosa (strain PCC 7806) TaxID=267872 RepID=A8YB69_MICA7|nr:unnamed protein product [Microcystis aeruginosa PCC 7806]